MTDKPELTRCAACRTERPVSEMETCMHAQMHCYVCDTKCMNDFYNPPKQALEPAGSYQKGYDEGRHQGTKHRVADIQQLEAARAADKARIAGLEKMGEGLLGLYREAESELKQCVIDRASFSDELRACTESPGGCGYWREAAKHRAGERDHALARIAELEAALSDVERDAARYRWLCSAGPGFDSRPFVVLLDLDSTKSDVDTAIDAALSQQGKEGGV